MHRGWRWAGWCALGVLACGPDTCLPDPPEGRIAASSQTDACRTELTEALQTFSGQQGFSYEVVPADVQAILDTGRLEKQYQRDGEQYGAFFGVDGSRCALMLYRTRRPSRGGHAITPQDESLPLPRCSCE